MSEWTFKTFKIYVDSLFRERDKALELQFKENDRRLDILNHAHEQAIEVQHTYVTEEKFIDFVKRYEENKDIISKALTLAEGSEQSSAKFWAAIIAGTTVFIAFFTFIAIIVTHFL